MKVFFAWLWVACALCPAVVKADDWAADVLNRGQMIGQVAPSSETDDEPAEMDNLVTGPSTAPAPISPVNSPERSISEFIGHFSGYEPTYFVAGPANPLAKFQFSFMYRLLSEDSPLGKKVPFLTGFNFAYTQLSLWQVDKASAPFYDNNYQPEFFWSNEDIRLFQIPAVTQFGLQTGYGHDSNGEAGSTSRSLNILFLRPIVTFGDPNHFHLLLAPKIYGYIFSLSDNPGIRRYRGYCDFRATVGWRQGLELSALGRLGSSFRSGGSFQLDLSYPIRDLLDRNLDIYLDAQYFNGFGESLLEYNKRTQEFRIGFALVR
jgi:outer membrane phospholipase A